MSKSAPNNYLDNGPQYAKDTYDRLFICSQQPTTYAEASSTYMLATVNITTTDFTVADGDTSGRKVTVAAQSTISPTNSGTATHVALGKSTGSELGPVDTMDNFNVSVGTDFNTNAFKLEHADPV